jgi:hypothetical protein
MKKIRNLLDIRRVNPFEAKFSVLYFASKKLLREKLDVHDSILYISVRVKVCVKKKSTKCERVGEGLL